MRHAEERLAKSATPSPPSTKPAAGVPVPNQKSSPMSPQGEATTRSRFLSKGQFLNSVLQKQRLQRSFFPEEVFFLRYHFRAHLFHANKAKLISNNT